MAKLLVRQKKTDEAIALYRQVLELDPDNRDVCFNLGAVMEALGRTREAAEFYGKALDIDPADSEARTRLDRLKS